MILYKLEHYRAGGEVAREHPEDITKILRVSGQALDLDYIERWARKLEEGEILAELQLPDHTGRVAPTVTPPPTATPDLRVRAWVPIAIKRR